MQYVVFQALGTEKAGQIVPQCPLLPTGTAGFLSSWGGWPGLLESSLGSSEHPGGLLLLQRTGPGAASRRRLVACGAGSPWVAVVLVWGQAALSPTAASTAAVPAGETADGSLCEVGDTWGGHMVSCGTKESSRYAEDLGHGYPCVCTELVMGRSPPSAGSAARCR